MSRTLPLLALIIACGGNTETPASPAPDAAAPEAPAPAPTADDHAAMLKAISVRKPEPGCQTLDQLAKDPVAAYKKIIATEKEPPYVPMRAATCLLTQHPREGEAEAVLWAADPEAEVLVMTVLGRLDTMPLDAAKKIAMAALKGPHKEAARLRIARLRTPELKALAGSTPQ